MTREEIVEGLKLLEDNMVHFDELQNDKGEWIDVHELLFEAIQALSQEPIYYPPCIDCNKKMDEIRRAYDKLKEQEPCDDAISREELLKAIDTWDKFGYTETGCFVRITKEIDNYVPYVHLEDVITAIQKLPPVTQKAGHFIDGVHAIGYREGYKDAQKQKAGKCKNCKYFEYDSVAKVDGIPLIVAHEICNKWGNGCKTSEDGYCYLFEPQERSKE